MQESIISVEIRNDSSLIISLKESRVFCQYSKSNNTQYIIAVYDVDLSNHIGGFRKEGKGYYFLFDKNTLAVLGQLERPNDGKVANNGFFIINDWLFTDNLESIAYCFDNHGNILIKHSIHANLLNSAISNNGQFALFQTANSNTKDGNNLFFFDLVSKKLLWQKKCDFHWPIKYSISNTEKKINLHYDDIGIFSLDWDGILLNKTIYQSKHIASLRGNRLSI